MAGVVGQGLGSSGGREMSGRSSGGIEQGLDSNGWTAGDCGGDTGG